MAFFDAFGVDVYKLAFQIINFLLILYLLNRFLFKRVLGLLDERGEKISKGLEDAEAAARDRELAHAEREGRRAILVRHVRRRGRAVAVTSRAGCSRASPRRPARSARA